MGSGDFDMIFGCRGSHICSSPGFSVGRYARNFPGSTQFRRFRRTTRTSLDLMVAIRSKWDSRVHRAAANVVCSWKTTGIHCFKHSSNWPEPFIIHSFSQSCKLVYGGCQPKLNLAVKPPSETHIPVTATSTPLYALQDWWWILAWLCTFSYTIQRKIVHASQYYYIYTILYNIIYMWSFFPYVYI